MLKMVVRVKITKELTIGGHMGIKGWPEATKKKGTATGKKTGAAANKTGAAMQIFTLEVWNFNPNTIERS